MDVIDLPSPPRTYRHSNKGYHEDLDLITEDQDVIWFFPCLVVKLEKITNKATTTGTPSTDPRPFTIHCLGGQQKEGRVQTNCQMLPSMERVEPMNIQKTNDASTKHAVVEYNSGGGSAKPRKEGRESVSADVPQPVRSPILAPNKEVSILTTFQIRYSLIIFFPRGHPRPVPLI